jgi:hypothetical protein
MEEMREIENENIATYDSIPNITEVILLIRYF